MQLYIHTTVQMYYAQTILLSHVFEMYSKQFGYYPNMQLQKSTIFRNAITTTSKFNNRWNPNEMQNVYMNTFSPMICILMTRENTPYKIAQHAVCHMELCITHILVNTRLEKEESAVITLDTDQMSSPTKCGKSVFSQLNGICEVSFGESAQAVLVEEHNKSERQTIVRKIVTETKEIIQEAMDETALNSVMGYRLSWRTYDYTQKDEGLSSRQKREAPMDENDQHEGKKCRHGCIAEIIHVDKATLLQTAASWPADIKVNRSDLTRQNGLIQKNGDQILKGFLAEHEVTAACKSCVLRVLQRN